MIERYEGGYGWDAGDPGGPTKYGITCYDLAQHRGMKMTSMAQWAPLVRGMPLDEAEEIYATKYAIATAFDEMNAGSDFAVFDFDVNSGNYAIKFSQRIVGVTVDGVMGPVTLEAINKMDPKTFVADLCSARLAFLRGLGTWSRFGMGWSARVNDLRTYCFNLIAAAAQPVSFMSAPVEETFVDKAFTFPLAFPKAWHPEFIAEIKQAHS